MESFFKSGKLVQAFYFKKNLRCFKKIVFATKLCFVANVGWAQVITWDFDQGTNGSDLPVITTTNVTAGNLIQGNNNGTTNLLSITSASSGYSNASGNFNAGAAAMSQPFNASTNTYFEFTLTPDAGYSITINSLKFGCRSTSTGPQAFSIRTSLDSYNSEIAGSAYPADGKWYLYQVPSLSISNFNSITVRIYGFNGVGAVKSTAVWRLDDLSLNVSATPLKTYMRSRQSGDWSQSSTWQTSFDGMNWNSSTSIPTKDMETILIQNGHTVTITSAVSIDQTTIAGTLDLKTGGILNINDGEGDDINILSNGILKISSSSDYTTSVIQSPNATINIAKNGKITLGDGVTLIGKGYENFATSTLNKWSDGAVFEYNNNAAFQIAGLTYFPNALATEIPVFRISKMNGAAAAGSGNDYNLNGLLELNTNVAFSGAGKKNFRNGIKGNYTLSQTGTGKFMLTGQNSILEGAPLKIVLSAVMDLSPSTIIPAVASVTINGGNINNGGLLTINGTLDISTNNINNAGTSLILNGIYRTAHPGGFSGKTSSIPSTTGNIILKSGSTVELYADADQTLNARDDFYNLILSGSGIKKPLGPFTPTGTVTIKDNAVFDCSGRNIGDEIIPTNLVMKGNSKLIVDTYGPNPKMSGTYDLSGGVIEFKGSNLTAETIRSRNYQKIEVSGSNVLMSEGNIGLNSNGVFTVKSGGVFSINDNTIIGKGDATQTIIVESGGTFKCGTNMGFNGAQISSIPIKSSAINRDITQIILQPNSTVEYTRNGDQPITNANGLVYQNLVISGSGNKTAPSDNLFIRGNFSKTSNAVFVHNNGTVLFTGNALQNYSSLSPQIIFNNLTNQNSFGLNVNDSLAVYKRLLFDNNSIVNLNADISLLSNKNQTAYLSKLGTNAKINYNNGRFIIERYINTNTINGGHQKSWQFISTPAFGETIFNTWQEKGNKTVAGYGTWITGVSNSDNSFDAVSVLPSMKYYDNQSDNWIGINSTNSNLENEKGYMIFLRGDRLSRAVNSPPTPTVLRTRGKIYVGDFTPPKSILAPGKFQSIGNPYPSAIDFSKINRVNAGSAYIAWDPTLYGTYGFGGYQTISAVTNYRAVPGNTSNYNATSDYRNIQSGQAFFVYNATSNEGSVSFTEDCKLDEGNHLVNKEIMPKRQMVFAQLFSENGAIADGNAVVFDQSFSNKINGDDVLKINNSGENFAIKNLEKTLSIEARESIRETDTIFYQLTNLSKQEYKLLLTAENFKEDVEAFLVDQYLNNKSQIKVNDTSTIFLKITDAASAKADRFFLVFKRIPSPAAAAVFSLNAYQQNVNVFLEWQIDNNSGKQFMIEHSSDGIHFEVIKIVDRNASFESNFLHNQPLNGNNYYRLSKVNSEGKTEYTEMVKVVMPKLSKGIHIFKNQFENKIVSLQFINQPTGKYTIKIFNNLGQVLLSTEIFHAGGNSMKNLELKNVSHQVAYVHVLKSDGDKTVLKFSN